MHQQEMQDPILDSENAGGSRCGVTPAWHARTHTPASASMECPLMAVLRCALLLKERSFIRDLFAVLLFNLLVFKRRLL